MRYIQLLLFFLLLFTRESMAAAVDEKYVSGGNYYVGAVFGPQDYEARANVTVKPFFIMTTEVTYAFWQSVYRWAMAQGYQFDDGCNGATDGDCLPPAKDDGQHPVTSIEWLDSILFANALSEKLHLQPVYRLTDGTPLRSKAQAAEFYVDSDANGYRLPDLNEWHIAARGGKPALKAGTYGNHNTVGANQENNERYSERNPAGTHPVRSEAANALGLYDMGSNVSEWVFDSELMGQVRMYYYCGGSYSFLTGSLASCDFHSAGYTEPDIGFRLVRSDMRAQ